MDRARYFSINPFIQKSIHPLPQTKKPPACLRKPAGTKPNSEERQLTPIAFRRISRRTGRLPWMQKARGDTDLSSVTVAYRLFSRVCTNVRRPLSPREKAFEVEEPAPEIVSLLYSGTHRRDARATKRTAAPPAPVIGHSTARSS